MKFRMAEACVGGGGAAARDGGGGSGGVSPQASGTRGREGCWANGDLLCVLMQM